MREISPSRFAGIVIGAAAAVFAGILAWGTFGPETERMAIAAMPETSHTFPICALGKRTTCVVDGDTIWMEGEKIRIADVDTPEIGEPKCESERALGHRAKEVSSRHLLQV